MLGNYLPVVVFLAVGMAVGGVMIALGFILGTRRPDSEKTRLMSVVSRRLKTPA